MGTIKIRIIEADGSYNLECAINNWLRENSFVHVVDIEYKFAAEVRGFKRITMHYAIITYESNEEGCY